MKYLVVAFILNLVLQLNLSANISKIKQLIITEESIAKALNFYIQMNGNLPLAQGTIDFDSLKPFLKSEIKQINPFLKDGILKMYVDNGFVYFQSVDINNSDKLLKKYYKDNSLRLHTKASLFGEESLGTKVKYDEASIKIIKALTSNKVIKTNKICEEVNKGAFFQYLKNAKLDEYYCTNEIVSKPIKTYQEEPILIEDYKNLAYVQSKIGARAFAQKNGIWSEFYYQGDVLNPWIEKRTGFAVENEIKIEDIWTRIISYIPDSKDIIIRDNGGCMLSNGDIFCWGDNSYHKAGLQSFGQPNPNINPDYINTPVMLKVDIDNVVKVYDENDNFVTRRSKGWYNNPYRVKFETASMNNHNVCGISPIFTYFDTSSQKEIAFGGDLYCNGDIDLRYFEPTLSDEIERVTEAIEKERERIAEEQNLSEEEKDALKIQRKDLSTKIYTQSSILKRFDFFNQHKIVTKLDTNGNNKIEPEEYFYYKSENAIFLSKLAMAENTIAVLTNSGVIYTINSSENSTFTPEKLFENQTTIFETLYAFKNSNHFAAIDNEGSLYIWGENIDGVSKNGLGYNSFAFINGDSIIVKTQNNNRFKYTVNSQGEIDWIGLDSSLNSSLSITYDNDSKYISVNENGQLSGTSELLTCQDSLSVNCEDDNFFNMTFNKLNEIDNEVGFASWQNIAIYQFENRKFACGMRGLPPQTQMYCWGDTRRSIPLINTSLYKISSFESDDSYEVINYLFVNPLNDSSDKTKGYFDYGKLIHEKYKSSKGLYLTYPTYISGFDYPFYFK